MSITLIGNNSKRFTNDNTAFEAENKILINANSSGLILPSVEYILITSEQYSRYEYVWRILDNNYVNRDQKASLVLPQELYQKITCLNSRHYEDGCWRLPNHFHISVDNDIWKYRDSYNDPDLLNALRHLANRQNIFEYETTDYSYFFGYLKLSECSTVNHYAIVVVKYDKNTNDRCLLFIVDYHHSTKVVDFYNYIKTNYVKIEFAWYYEPDNTIIDTPKLTESEFLTLPVDIQNNTVLVDTDNSTIVGTRFLTCTSGIPAA